MRLLLMRVAAVDHDIDGVETGFKKALIGLELERRRHDAGGIGEHAVLRNDGKAFDMTGMMHGIIFSLGLPASIALFGDRPGNLGNFMDHLRVCAGEFIECDVV